MQKKTRLSAQQAKKAKIINCGPAELKGAMKQDKLLIAGLLVIILASAIVIGNILVSWNKGAREANRAYESNIQNLQTRIGILERQAAQNGAGSAAGQSAPASQNSSEEFEKAVNEKDFKTVEALMADNVYYVVDASDCCGDISRKEVVDQLKKYIRGAKSFDFDQEQQVVKQMKVNLAGTFSRFTIGVADNRMVLSYKLDKQGKVNNIMLSASHLMYDLE